jgi:ABC-type glutathione transport system ATPase component
MSIQESNPLLSLRLTVDYPNRPETVRNVCFEINRGEVVGLVGQSGSGKSTIALSILGLLSMKGGRAKGAVVFESKDLLAASERELRAMRGKDIALVLQSPLSSLNPAVSIGSQLREAWSVHSKERGGACTNAISEALTSVSLPHDDEFLKRKVAEISVGQAQRVLIAMAVLHRPKLLICDEPTSALDVITQSEILALFRRLNRELGIAILYISHDLLSVGALCDRVAILKSGELVEQGLTAKVFSAPSHPYTRRLVDAVQSQAKFFRNNAEAAEPEMQEFLRP